jgi:squalene-hopene/tetraprenyl-beta-curcumene cyclase
MTYLIAAVVTVVVSAGEPASDLAARAQSWLVGQAQPDGALQPSNVFRLGVTALAAQALVDEPLALPADHPAVAGAARFLARHRQADGGVYDPDEGLGVYGTSLALQFAVKLPASARAGLDVAAMQAYLLRQQNGDAASVGAGGIGYGDKGQGSEDVSNTTYALRALRASGVSAEDPRMRAAMAFLERCQDLSTVNRAPWVRNSGGGVYGPQDAARSWATGDETQAGRWTPSATMTYALISGYLTLDLAPDDPRVVAALRWIGANYGFDRNPGMGPGKEAQGLFHAYALAGTVFDRLPQAEIQRPDGTVADWRSDLLAALSQRAQATATGAYWINSAPRWGEGMPHLCTAYALRTLKVLARQGR